MRALAAVVAALFVLAACGDGSDASRDSAGTSTQRADAVADEPSAPEPEPDDPPTDDYVAPKPDGTYTQSCDYVLGDFTESASGYRFVADARLHNTGNIGTVTRVRATWFLAGGDEITELKSVRVGPGKRKRVGFVHVATDDEIDLHQSLGYGTKTCKVRATIVDTYGDLHGR